MPRPTSRTAWLAGLLLVAGARGATAQGANRGTPPPPPPPAPAEAVPASAKVARATRLTGTGIHVDGRLVEPEWATASWFSDFTQKEPVEGGTPTDRTEVAFFYDDDAIYVGARLYSTRVNEIPRPVTRRDQFTNAEFFIVALDPYHDKRTGYSFSVSSGGVRGDSYHPEDEENFRDPAFNPVWDAHVTFDSLGWYVEMRIPFSQLRFNRQDVQEWGLNINRWRPGFNEDIYWVMIPRKESGFFSRFGTLEGMDDIQPQRSAEFIPYVAGTADFVGQPTPGNPFVDASSAGFRAGADFKVGIGQNLTLDATINPDFGQVEADPAEVNLTAFETFFPEQRPFFIEGNQLLEGNGPGYYYSRRIGAQPNGQPTGGVVTDADFVDIPGYATILGAAKLTGRTGAGTSVGALVALTQREYASTYNIAGDEYHQVAVEPMTFSAVGRVQQEVGKSSSTIGATLTALSRSFSDAAALSLQLPGEAFSGGADWQLRFQDNMYQVGGWAGFSHVGGTTEAITALQEAPAHYFQAPGQTYAPLDTLATSLSGYSLGLSGEKLSGKWTGYLGGSAESPGFELNDLGRLQSANDIDLESFVNYRETTPGKVFRNYRIGMFGATGWNFGGVRTYSILRLNTNQIWRNWWRTFIGAYYRPRGMSDDLTRGGPLMGTGYGSGVNISLSNNEANPVQGNLNLNIGWGEFGQQSQNVGLYFSARPSSRLQLSLAPSWTHSLNPRQYVTAVDSSGYPSTYDARYVFATVDQYTLRMQVRLNYSFTPDLTLEVYAEPFVSSGAYTTYGELTAAGASSLRLYGTDGTTITQDPDGNYTVTDGVNGETFALLNNDFNVLNYRSNVVMRWEWRPGSTLFFIWSQNRNSFCSGGYVSDTCYQEGVVPGSGIEAGNLLETRSVPGDNTLIVKATYWFNLR